MDLITLPKLIEVVANSGYPTGSSVKVTNLSNGEVMTKDLQQRKLTINQNDKCIVVIDNFPSGWTANDVIEIELSGIKYGSTTVTLNSTATKQTTSIIAAGSMTVPAWRT